MQGDLLHIVRGTCTPVMTTCRARGGHSVGEDSVSGEGEWAAPVARSLCGLNADPRLSPRPLAHAARYRPCSNVMEIKEQRAFSTHK